MTIDEMLRVKPLSREEPTDQPRTMGRSSVQAAEKALQRIGGVTEMRRYAHQDGGSYFGVVWWFRGGRMFFCDNTAFTRWLYTSAGLPVPAWVPMNEGLRP